MFYVWSTGSHVFNNSLKTAIYPHCTVNKPHLLRPTKHMLISVQLLPLHMCYMFRPVLRPPTGMSIPKPYKGRHNENISFVFVQSMFFILLKHKICNFKDVQGCWKVLSPTRKETSYSDRSFWYSYILKTKKINQQNAQINSGLIYYWSITPTCFGPSVEAIIREFEILESYKAIVLIC